MQSGCRTTLEGPVNPNATIQVRTYKVMVRASPSERPLALVLGSIGTIEEGGMRGLLQAVRVGGGGIINPPLRLLHPSPRGGGGAGSCFLPLAGVRSGLPAGQRVGPPFEVKWYCSCELLPSETNPWDHYNPVSGQAAGAAASWSVLGRCSPHVIFFCTDFDKVWFESWVLNISRNLS